MSRLSHLSEHSADVVCIGPSNLNTRGLLGGEDDVSSGNDSNLLIVFYVQIMPDDFVMQLHRF